jgi:hypothetical protein
MRWTGADATILHVFLVLGMTAMTAIFAYTLVWLTPLMPSHSEFIQPVVNQPAGAPNTVPGVETAREDVTISGTGDMVLDFAEPSAWERFMLALPVLFGLAVAFIVFYLLLKLVKSLGAGDPFNPLNARRVYGIAVTVLVGAVLGAVIDGFTTAQLQQAAVGESHVFFSLNFDSGTSSGLFIGFLLVALAEVFRRGTRMREDVEGLV